MAYSDLTSVVSTQPLDLHSECPDDPARVELTEGGNDHRPPSPDTTPVAD